MNLIDLAKDAQYGAVALKFETHWNLQAKYKWANKQNAWISWLHDGWNCGLINLLEYRFLINVDIDVE